MMPTDVSAWTAVTIFTLECRDSSSSSSSAGKGLPHSERTGKTLAPTRSAISTMRSQKKPYTHMTTVSSGSNRLVRPASIPAEPVPDRAKVKLSSVWNTLLSSSETSSMMARKSASR